LNFFHLLIDKKVAGEIDLGFTQQKQNHENNKEEKDELQELFAAIEGK
jgi:hypothetical protein